jgi:predicted nuclease of predicted toxin-antitoxin system
MSEILWIEQFALAASPQILWRTCGNITNRDLQRIFTPAFPEAVDPFNNGASIGEIARVK